MTKFEKRILDFTDQHLPLLLAAFCTILGIAVRVSLRDVISGDYRKYLLPWYDTISANGLSQQVGNYSFLYQFVIWILTKIRISSLYAYKICSCIFDWVLAITASVIVRSILEHEKEWAGCLAYCTVLLSPIVFLNSAAWAQCDAIYSAFALLAILYLERKQYTGAMCFLGVSFAFKLQAVFVLPFFLFVYFAERKFSAARFLLVPCTMLILSLPVVLWGRSLTEVVRIYFNQTGTYQAMSMNYPSPWLLLCQALEPTQYAYLKKAAIIVTVFVLAMLMIWWIRKAYVTTGKDLYMMAFLLVYTCVLFLPSMHERYGYLYEVLAIILAILIPKTIPLCAGLLTISMNTYGIYLFGVSGNCSFLACANLFFYCAYIYSLKEEFRPGITEKKKKELPAREEKMFENSTIDGKTDT